MPGDWCRGSAPARRATTWQDALELAKKCVLKGKSSPPPGAHLQWDHWRCLQWWYSDALKDHDFPEQTPTPRQGVIYLATFSNSVSISPIDLKLNPAKSLLLWQSPSTDPTSVLKHRSTSLTTTEQQRCLPTAHLCHLLHLAFIETHGVKKILVHVNKSLLNRLFHMKYQKLTSTNSYL